MCLQRIHTLRKTGGPRWRTCGFQISFFLSCVMTSSWCRGRIQPVKGPPVLLLGSTRAIRSLIHLLLKKDSLSSHRFPRVTRDQENTEIYLWPQCTLSPSQCSFSYWQRDADNEIWKVRLWSPQTLANGIQYKLNSHAKYLHCSHYLQYFNHIILLSACRHTELSHLPTTRATTWRTAGLADIKDREAQTDVRRTFVLH